MPLRTTTDHAEITDLLTPLVEGDPVGGTLLGTIVRTLTDSAWLAADGPALAVRSASYYPVALTGPWTQPLLAELASLAPDPAGFSGTPDLVDDVVGLVGRPVDHRMGQRLFRLDELTEPTGVAGRAVVADAGHRDVVRAWVAAFMSEADAFGANDHSFADRLVETGHCWLWLDDAGTPVSLAARRPVIAGSARVGPVYTPPGQRGHGYGSGVTAAATRSILDEGGVPVLFTDLANPTSNKIYQLLGYRPVEDRVVVSFVR